MIEWHLNGIEYGSCNCDHCCPCQFEGLPTHGDCNAFSVIEVTDGDFDGVDLAGVVAAAVYRWPGPVFEGGGEMQIIIDERASEDQRNAIEQIMLGRETVEASTHWWVFAAMSETKHETLVKRIDAEVDMEARTASCSIDDMLEFSAEPIRSRVDGSPHQVRIQVPQGIEFETAEIVNAQTRTQGAIELVHDNSFGQLSHIKHTYRGPVYNQQPA